MTPMLLSALVLGAAGSAHCVGMCGPIALAVPGASGTPWGRWRSTLLLNGGRLTTYALLGSAVGALGLGLRLAGLQQVVAVVCGMLLLGTSVVPGFFARWSPNGRLALWISRLRSVLARNLKRAAPEALFFTGVLNGLLPCGLSYAALLGAGATGTPAQGMLFMAAFGIGTWPALVALRLGAGRMDVRMRSWFRRLSPLLLAMVGLLLVLRGLQLGIPFVSPGPVGSGESAVCP
jgi:sulfite exporter TauE/SafE